MVFFCFFLSFFLGRKRGRVSRLDDCYARKPSPPKPPNHQTTNTNLGRSSLLFSSLNVLFLLLVTCVIIKKTLKPVLRFFLSFFRTCIQLSVLDLSFDFIYLFVLWLAACVLDTMVDHRFFSEIVDDMNRLGLVSSFRPFCSYVFLFS